MSVLPVPAHELLHRFILGGLAAAAVASIAWLMLGDLPPLWVLLIGSELLCLTVTAVVTVRRNRAWRRIQDAYERPAFGEGPTP